MSPLQAYLWNAAILLLSIAASSLNLHAQESSKLSEARYDIWIIDTHTVGEGESNGSSARFLRLDDNGGWQPSSEDGFLQSLSPSKPVNYVLPGYMSDLSLGIEQAWSYHHHLDQHAKTGGASSSPTRIVLWAWPSERQGLAILRDARNKAARAEREGAWLAQHLIKLPRNYRAHLLAHSFGARIAAAAAQHLASAAQSGEPGRLTSPRLTGTLIAPAIDSDWLEAGRPHQLALGRFEKLLLVNNSSDRVLKRYRFLDRSSRQEAVGFVGLTISDRQLARKIQQIDASHLVGKVHHWHQHFESPTIMASIAPIALFKEDTDQSVKGLASVTER